MGDFAMTTLERRKSKIPELIEARKKGKAAYMVMGKLIILNKPRVSAVNKPHPTTPRLDDTDDDGKVTLSGKLHS